MAAVIELSIFNMSRVKVQDIIKHVSINSTKNEILSIEVFDDWQFSNHVSIENLETFDELDKYILTSKIVQLSIKSNEKYHWGFQMYAINQNIINISLWLDTEHLPYLDVDYINDRNKEFYEFVTNQFLDFFQNSNILIAGMGVELVIEYYENINDIVSNSRNVVRWITPQNIDVYNYEKNKKDNLYMYTLHK